MNLPKMLRGYDIIFANDAHTDHASGPDISEELAALVEAADAVRKWTCTCTAPCECPDCMAAEDYDAARDALVAKIGGTR